MKKMKKSSKINRLPILFMSLMLAFPLLQFLVFYVYININSLLLAFKTFDLSTGLYNYSGLNNIKQFLLDMKMSFALQSATKNSIIIYCINLFLLIPVQIMASFYVYKKYFLGRFFYIILFVPSLVSQIVMSIMFKYFVDGAFPELLLVLGVQAENIPDFFYEAEYAFKTVIAYNIWIGIGSGIILYSGAMSRIPPSLIEYGQLEGVNSLQELLTIVVPLISPTITVFIITSVVGFFTNQAGLYGLYGNGANESMYTYGYFIFVKIVGQDNATLANYPYASAAGLIFTLIAAPITLIVKYLLERFTPSVEF